MIEKSIEVWDGVVVELEKTPDAQGGTASSTYYVGASGGTG